MKFYHISENELFNKDVIKPKVPINKMNIEDETPRICVSSSILGALSGRNCKLNELLYVFETDTDDFFIPDVKNVPDQPLSGETWILNDCNFNFTCKILIKEIFINKINNLEVQTFKFEIL